MKVQHVTVSENSVHNSCVLLTVIWTWNFVPRQTWRNLQHGLRLHVPWFLLQVNCEHWRCVNRRSPCCRGVGWLHACRRATVTWVVLDKVGSQVCFFSTLCWYPCCVSVCTAQCRAHTHLSVHNLAAHMCHLPYNCHLHSPLVGPLVPYKSCVSHFMYRCRTCVDWDSTILYFVFYFFHNMWKCKLSFLLRICCFNFSPAPMITDWVRHFVQQQLTQVLCQAFFACACPSCARIVRKKTNKVKTNNEVPIWMWKNHRIWRHARLPVVCLLDELCAPPPRSKTTYRRPSLLDQCTSFLLSEAHQWFLCCQHEPQ